MDLPKDPRPSTADHPCPTAGLQKLVRILPEPLSIFTVLKKQARKVSEAVLIFGWTWQLPVETGYLQRRGSPLDYARFLCVE